MAAISTTRVLQYREHLVLQVDHHRWVVLGPGVVPPCDIADVVYAGELEACLDAIDEVHRMVADAAALELSDAPDVSQAELAKRVAARLVDDGVATPRLVNRTKN